MNFVDKYSTFSRWFYLVILGLTIPYYLVLYGASGHQFNLSEEDVLSIFIVIVAFVTLIAFLRLKEKSGLGFNLLRIFLMITLLVTAYGGLRIFLFMIQFDYGYDISYFTRGLSYLIPAVFTFSSIIILIGLFKKED